MRALAESSAGLIGAISLALPAIEGRTAAGVPAAVSIAALARRFCVSRAHARKPLRRAEADGFLAACDPARIIATSALPEAILACHTRLFLLFDRCAVAAGSEERRRGDAAGIA